MRDKAPHRQDMDFEDEYEHRATARSNSPVHDPLAELAKIVDGDQANPLSSLFQSRIKSAPAQAQREGMQQRQSEDVDEEDNVLEKIFGSKKAISSHELKKNIKMERGNFRTEPRLEIPQMDHHLFPQGLSMNPKSVHYNEHSSYDEEFRHQDEDYEEEQSGGARKTIYSVGLCLVLLGAAAAGYFVYKGNYRGNSQPPLIMAGQEPDKVAPVDKNTADDGSQPLSVLDKNSGKSAETSRVIDKIEQPVDISKANKTAPRVILPGPQTDASQIQRSQVEAMGPSFPEPKRVRSVSVRPDGSLVTQPQLPPPAAPVAETTTAIPQTQATTKSPTTQPIQKNANTAKIQDRPVNTTQKGRDPISILPNTAVEKSATTTASAQTTGGGDGWHVQLAAVGSEAEAKQRASALSKKYSELDGYKLSVQRGENTGKTVWRIRVVGLKQADALELCSRLKAGGGACYTSHSN